MKAMKTFEIIIVYAALMLFSCFVTSFINYHKKAMLSATDEVKLRIQLVELLHSGNYSDEELDYIIGNNEELLKLKDEYLKAVKR